MKNELNPVEKEDPELSYLDLARNFEKHWSVDSHQKIEMTVQHWEEARREGNSESELYLQRIFYKMAKCFEFGYKNIEKDLHKAIKYYELAYSTGERHSIHSLKRIYCKLALQEQQEDSMIVSQ